MRSTTRGASFRSRMANADPIALDIFPGDARVEWQRDGLSALAGPDAQARMEAGWRLDGEPDWEAIESLRLISAAFEDGRMLALVTTRPTRADGHDEAYVRGALVQANGEVVELAEALLSIEYDAGGTPARIGLELYTYPEAIPLRVAADRSADRADQDESPHAIAMSFRLEGSQGAGLLELVSRP